LRFSNMLDLPGTLLATTAVIDFGLALFIYGENRTSRINGSFALFVLFLSGWALAVLAFLATGSDAAAVWYLKLSYVAAALIAGCYYYFSLVFPEGDRPSRGHEAVVSGGTLLLCLALLIPGFLTGAVTQHAWGREVALDTVPYLVFATTFCVFFIGGQIRLWWKYALATGPVRRQLLAIGASVTPVGLVGMYYNLVLVSPFLQDFRFIWTGPVFTSVFAVVIAYSVFRYQLFTAKAIIAEILVFALWFFVFVRMLLATLPGERIANAVLLAVAVPIGVLLLRSVKIEMRARESLALANVRLKELDRAKTEFLSIAAHQLRGPVTAMRGYAENLKDGTYGVLPTDAATAADRIADRSRALAAVIEDYLDVSRIELGRMKYDFRIGDMKELVRRVIEELTPVAKAAKLELTFATIGDGPFLARIDAGKIAQVVSNLIDNAIKYTPSGSIAVELARKYQAGPLLLAIRDTGIGIDRATIPRLFQKFSRAEDAGRTNATGTGLGLYVVAQLVTAHGGRVWAESLGPGQGSTFFVELPAAA
jgi:signal transduction histidine kinase